MSGAWGPWSSGSIDTEALHIRLYDSLHAEALGGPDVIIDQFVAPVLLLPGVQYGVDFGNVAIVGDGPSPQDIFGAVAIDIDVNDGGGFAYNIGLAQHGAYGSAFPPEDVLQVTAAFTPENFVTVTGPILNPGFQVVAFGDPGTSVLWGANLATTFRLTPICRREQVVIVP